MEQNIYCWDNLEMRRGPVRLVEGLVIMDDTADHKPQGDVSP